MSGIDDDTSDGGMSAGGMSAGSMSAGGMSAGSMSAGDMSRSKANNIPKQKEGLIGRTKSNAVAFKNKTIKGFNKFSDNNSLARAARHYVRGISNKKPIRKLAKGTLKVASKGAVGAVGAGLGLAFGVASGDLSKAMQYSITGGVSGYGLAGSIGNAAVGVKDALSVDGTAQVFYGEEAYEQKQIERNIKEAQKDGNIKMALADKFGYERAREIRNDILPDCVRYGLTDINDIMTVAKMEGTNVGGRTVSREDAIRSVIQVNDMGKNTSKLGAKDSEDLDNTLVNRAKKNKKVKDEAQAKRVAARTRELMDQTSRIKYKM